MRFSASLVETLLQTSRTFLGGTASVCDISLNYKAILEEALHKFTDSYGARSFSQHREYSLKSCLLFPPAHILNIFYKRILYALYFYLMHLNDLFDGLRILKSMMQLLDNFATLVKPRESFSEFLLRKCLRSSLDIHISYFRNVKYDIVRSMRCIFFSF